MAACHESDPLIIRIFEERGTHSWTHYLSHCFSIYSLLLSAAASTWRRRPAPPRRRQTSVRCSAARDTEKAEDDSDGDIPSSDFGELLAPLLGAGEFLVLVSHVRFQLRFHPNRHRESTTCLLASPAGRGHRSLRRFGPRLGSWLCQRLRRGLRSPSVTMAYRVTWQPEAHLS